MLSPKLPRRLAGALAVCLSVLACTAAPSPSPASTQVPQAPVEISVADAVAMRDDGAFVLDVREPSEFAAGHISGATLIPLGELATRVGEVPRDRSVIVVCRTGHRAAQGRDILIGAGFYAVSSMTGGMTEWIAQGQPIVTGGGIQ